MKSVQSSQALQHYGEGQDGANTRFVQPMVLRYTDASEPLRVSGDFVAEFGLSAEDIATEALIDWIHPQDRVAFESALDARGGALHARHRKGDGDWGLLSWRIRTEGDRLVVLGVPCSGPTSEPPVRSEQSPMLSPGLKKTLEAAVHVVESKNPGLRCSILLVSADGSRVSVGAGPSLPREYNAAVEGLEIGPAVGSCGTAAFWNVPVVVDDIARDPLWRNLRPAAALAGVGACWSVPITTEAGQVLGAMALYDDKPSGPMRHQIDMLQISARMVGHAIERDQLELRLRDSAKIEALGVMAAGVAHDFNNLLSVIMGNAELAMSALSGHDQTRINLQNIVTASTTATDLCTQLLAFTGRGSSSTMAFDCNILAQEMGELLKAAISKKVTLDYNLHDSPLGVIADRSQLRQVLMNLITNASEAYCEEQGVVTVETGAAHYDTDALEISYRDNSLQPGEYCRIRVSDNGAGMQPEVLQRIFDPFFTTKRGGRGLGLAAVKGIVSAHGGGIRVESEPGVGTSFELILPLISLPADEQKPRTETSMSARSARILIGEDEALVRETLTMAIRRAGYDVVEAVDGQDVVDVFQRNAETIDCVLLDLNMPKLDGEAVFAQLRKIQPDVRVILSSGFAEQEVLDRFEGAGVAGFVHKPVSLGFLLEKIAQVLDSGDD